MVEGDMADPGTIREIIERNAKLLALKPSRGQVTHTTRARLAHGLRCEIEDGPWRLAADMPAKAGGDETAPNPGVLGRAALASCLAIEIATWSARLGVQIENLEVEVQADFDARGEIGFEGVRPGYSEVRYAISVDSPAPDHELARVLELVERHSPYLDVFSTGVPLKRIRHLNGKEA
jgi:uncharacterized OsmC-like protein